MKYTYQYNNESERLDLIDKNKDKYLLEESRLIDGNYIVFGDEPNQPPIVYVSVPSEDFENLKQDNTLLKAQSKALAERAAFTDDVIAEIAIKVYE
ncbi:hypothetical protein [Paenibacillus pabuli]|uniref:hypothetical protein n=1 Tax=Paenibacillus pabuli TaxID=1472 RepID=UPI0007844FF3|nr:hypothetical protein [Paenibacillus pabuli]MEC0125359.1 hypothetical protein [Paenibacillus pabuli]